MKLFITELEKYTKKVKLTASERRELRERVVSYMEYHPLPDALRTQESFGIPSESFITIPFNTWYTRIGAGAFAILLIIGVPLAAERAVPGEALYLVKTGFNENIGAQFANSPYEKVAYETKMLERRIAEARLLAKEGKLSDKVEAEIAETVKNHARAAQESIAVLKAADADEGTIAEIAFSSTLDVQSAVFDSATASLGASSTRSIASAVREAKETMAAQQSSTSPSYERLLARVERETTRAYELFNSVKYSATDEERQSVERRLADIDRKIADIVASHEATGIASSTEATSTPEVLKTIPSLSTTLGDIQRIITFMTDIDVRSSVALDTLVPVVLTKEERTAAVVAELETAQAEWAIITPRIAYVPEEAVKEKLDLAASQVGAYIEAATSSLAAGNIEEAENVVRELKILIQDLKTSTIDIEVPKEDVPVLEEEGSQVETQE